MWVSYIWRKRGRTPSVATWSARSLSAQYHKERATQLKERSEKKAEAQKCLRLNPWAVAIQRNPDMWRRKKGVRRLGESCIDANNTGDVVHEGDMEGLRAYYADNIEELTRYCEQKRAAAKQVLRTTLPPYEIPQTATEWEKFARPRSCISVF